MTDLVYVMIIFLVVGVVFFYFHMILGKLVRPARPEAEKLTIYECGEPTVGSAWIQFDVRYYVVALLFVIFDVEVAFFFPWAIVFGSLNEVARKPDDAAEVMKMQASGQAAKADNSQAQDRLSTQLTLLPDQLPERDKNGAIIVPGPGEIAANAKNWAWVAFCDIFVFFGVLMVGFAYLWRRGDIDWVRSTASEKVAGSGPEALSAHPMQTVG